MRAKLGLGILGLVTALLAQPHAAARRRVIVLDETDCGFGWTRPAPVWVVTPPDDCPGRTLIAHCGDGPVPAGCPSLEEALAVASLDACRPDLGLLAVAEALARTDRLDAAGPVYQALFTSPTLGAVARLRAAWLAYRRSEYRAAVDTLVELLSRPMPPRSSGAAIDLYAAILSYDDFDEDGVPDRDRSTRPLDPAWLPDAPTADAVALRVLERVAEARRTTELQALIAAFRSRFPGAHTEAIERLDLDARRANGEVVDGAVPAPSSEQPFAPGVRIEPLIEPGLLAACIPPRGAVLELALRMDDERRWSVDATPNGRTASCIEDALAPDLPAPTDPVSEEPGVVHGHVWLVGE